MRPIWWGIITFAVGAVGWVVFVVLAVITGGAFKLLANIFGWMFVLSLPLAVFWELVRWLMKRNNK